MNVLNFKNNSFIAQGNFYFGLKNIEGVLQV